MRTPRQWELPTTPTAAESLFRMGVSRQMIATQVAAGRLLRLRHGVYLAASMWPTEPAAQHVMLARAELVANPEAVLSGQSAAAVWLLPNPSFTRWHDLPVAVTFPTGGSHSSRSGRTRHRVAVLPPGHVVCHPDGFRVTSVARTAIDVAAGLDLPKALVVLDGAARRMCESMHSVRRRSDYAAPHLVTAARSSFTAAQACGVARLNEAIEAMNPARESAAESLSAGHILLSGLPVPLYQARIDSLMGPLYPDCLWPEQRVIGECDGAVKYADPSAWVREKRREQVLRDMGFTIVRWLAHEVMTTPAVVIARLRRALF